MQMSQQQQLPQQLVVQHQGQQLLHGMPEGAEIDDAEERERLRLRKERRKQKKDRKRARREQKLQQQQQQQMAMGHGIPGGQMEPHGVLQSAMPLQTGPAVAALGEASAIGGNDDGNFDGMSSVGSADGQ